MSMRDRLDRLVAGSKSAARKFGQAVLQPRYASIVFAGAEVGVNLLPMLAPIVNVAKEIVEMCEQMESNKRAAQQLTQKCSDFVTTLEEALRPKFPSLTLEENIRQALAIIKLVAIRVKALTEKHKVKAFLEEQYIANEIGDCISTLDRCLSNLYLQSGMAIIETQHMFERNRMRDHEEVVDRMSTVQDTQSAILQITREYREDIRNFQAFMQEILGQLEKTNDPRRFGLAANLHLLLQETGDLLPNLHLEHGEVQVSTTMLRTTREHNVTDYYLGTFLGKQKVVVKTIRSALADNPEWIRRFRREAEVWTKVWKEDKGTYTVPVLGFVKEPHTDLPNMCLVYPYYEHNALDYVRNNDTTDHMRILQGIAKGLAFMHDMDVMHGDVRGASVMIDEHGKPLLSEFGLSKIIEDANKNPTVILSCELQLSQRWAAPEVLDGGMQSKSSDVFSYGMTVLELLTHEAPWYYLRDKSTFAFTSKVVRGQRPERPTLPIISVRGLDDAVWDLLQKCWAENPLERPDMHSIVESLQALKHTSR